MVSNPDPSPMSALLVSAMEAKVVAERAGAAVFAAWVRYHADLEPSVAVVVSGGNVDPKLLMEILSERSDPSGEKGIVK